VAEHPNGAGRLEQIVNRLVDQLKAQSGHQPEVIQTHISFVILTQDYAYKLKKPVDLGFLDFSSLAKRKHYCERELLLNRRTAPQLYLDVVAVTGSPEQPELGGDGEAIEYAVRMRRFPDSAILDRVLARGELSPATINSLADGIARFHASAEVAGPDSPFGKPADIEARIRDTLKVEISPRWEPLLTNVRNWLDRRIPEMLPVLEQRRARGSVRDCHGDLHLTNLVLLEGNVVAFDCIEFNDKLRWVDVMSDLAFPIMDLQFRQRPDLARRLLNDYLDMTGDYAGLTVLRLYLVYRSMVRARVADIQRRNHPDDTAVSARVHDHLALAAAYTSAVAPRLVLTHGLSGSGKTWLTDRLVAEFDVVRIRSDVERKRLAGTDHDTATAADISQGIYSADMTKATYQHLRDLAAAIISGGYTAVVDAAFLRGWQRQLFAELAEQRAVPLWILNVTAPEAVLRQRIRQRQQHRDDASDADLAVLAHQLTSQDPLTSVERARSIDVDTSDPNLDVASLARQLTEV
jgi:aminoglycoside phosphotransferase family enzyme/predicted kinase